MDLQEFQNVVDEVVQELPGEFASQLENVDIIVDIWPTQADLQSVYAHPGTTLYGLYQGIPKTKRGANYSGVLPDKITIFAGPILNFAPTLEAAKKQIRKTVLHEIGHYFGMTEDQIRAANRKHTT
jgi:predicted Zn-dependent protease with MMP-like domain